MSESRSTHGKTSIPPISLRRRFTDHAMTGVAVLTVLLVLAPLIAIFAYLVYKGIGSLNWAFLTQTPKPVGEPGGGMANAIVGSVIILGIASVIGVPFGIGAGIYLAEFGRNRLGSIIRFTADVLSGVPSIVIGIVGWAILVRGHGFSALAGGVALSIMMVPTICRTTEEMLLLVPQALREAAYGLGVPRWRTTLSIVLRTATSGVITGVMLAFARRRDGSASIYCARQHILESEIRSADLCVTTANLRVRKLPLRRLAQTGVGRFLCLDRSDYHGGCGRALCCSPRLVRDCLIWALEFKSRS
jgi:phosphate ABC transporter permease subunit PstA